MPLFHGDLLGALPNMSLESKERAMAQIVIGLKHMHKHGMVHCDIKPNNIFIREATPLNIVIGDLGLTRTADDLRTGCGTRVFMAPECFLPERVGTLIPAIDVFALGRTFHVKLNFDRIKKIEGLGSRVFSIAPPHFPRLVRQMTVTEPTKRPALERVQQLLNERKDYPTSTPTSSYITGSKLPESSRTCSPMALPIPKVRGNTAPTANINQQAQPCKHIPWKQTPLSNQRKLGQLDITRRLGRYPKCLPLVIREAPLKQDSEVPTIQAFKRLNPIPEEAVKVHSQSRVDFTIPPN